MTKIVGVCVFMLVVVAVCSPEDMARGNFLLNSCQVAIKALDDQNFTEHSMQSFQRGYCLGIILGVSGTSHDACPGDHVTFEQLTRVVVKYLQEHPEELRQAKLHTR